MSNKSSAAVSSKLTIVIILEGKKFKVRLKRVTAPKLIYKHFYRSAI